MRTRTRRREAAKALIDRAIRETYIIAGEHNGPGFAYLLNEVQKRSDLLPPSRYIGRADANSLVEIVGGLLALSVHMDDWRRPIEDWEPRESNPLPLFDELAHYLLADYPVPPVMRSVWFLGISYQARHRQGWYKHVGGGGSLRTARFPLDLTRRMAHEFAQAPRTFAVEYALRWAQVIALGGSDELACAIASTRLGLEFNEDEFWTQVVHFFINHPELDHDHIGPIVEYIELQKFQPVKVLIGESTEIELDPPQPNFTIKGRTPASILRLVADWRQKGPAVLTRRVFCWQPSATGGYREEAEDGRVWTIRELLDSDELVAGRRDPRGPRTLAHDRGRPQVPRGRRGPDEPERVPGRTGPRPARPLGRGRGADGRVLGRRGGRGGRCLRGITCEPVAPAGGGRRPGSGAPPRRRRGRRSGDRPSTGP
jgi:hypothetical protein